jgi:hypothetical protein
MSVVVEGGVAGNLSWSEYVGCYILLGNPPGEGGEVSELLTGGVGGAPHRQATNSPTGRLQELQKQYGPLSRPTLTGLSDQRNGQPELTSALTEHHQAVPGLLQSGRSG